LTITTAILTDKINKSAGDAMNESLKTNMRTGCIIQSSKKTYSAAKGKIMRDGDREEIKKIMSGMQCKKNFACSESGFKRLCKAENIGIENVIRCLEEKPSVCSFALPFGDVHYCQCQLRIYLSKKLKK
jgi:hypothetical protein